MCFTPRSPTLRPARRTPRVFRRLLCARVPVLDLRTRTMLAILFTLGVIAIGSAFTLGVNGDAPSVEIARSR